MAALLRLLLLLFIFSDSLGSIHSLGVGINYGLRSNSSLPPPSVVASHLQSLNITKVKIYPEDPTVLSAFANTSVEIIIRIEFEYMERLTDPNEARKWIEHHVHPYIPQTKIKGITFDYVSIGNIGIITTELFSHLLPAMRAISGALTNLRLNEEIFVSTVLPLEILNKTFPPSASTFKPDSIEFMQNILDFLGQIKSPLFIEAYLVYYDGGTMPLEYAIFQANPGKIDPNTKLHYHNMLYEQIDSFYWAMKALGHTDIKVVVSETGWFSSQPEIAGLYIGNLLDRIQQNQGTPARPKEPLDAYAALFPEDLTSLGEFALYNSHGTPLCRLGLRGYLPRLDYSSSRNNNVLLLFNLLFPIIFLVAMLFMGVLFR